MSRRIIVTSTAMALGLLLAAPPSAAHSDAVERGARQVRTESERPHRRERLRLRCAVAPAIDHRGIGCVWSATHHPHAAGYVLVRSVDGGDRTIVHRGGLDQTRFLDQHVRPGHRYTYWVFVVDAGGHRLGGGGPVTVGIPD